MGRISFTMDCWSDFDCKQYMAVTAHWIESKAAPGKQKLSLRVDLIGFLLVLGSHTGECLAEELHFLIGCLNLSNKVSIYYFSLR